MVIRPLHRAARTRRQARQLHRQPDLIERPLSGLSQAGRNAGRFFLQKGLPLVGVALGGGAGLAAGTVATGVLSYLDAPEQSPRQRLTGALVTAAGAGLVCCQIYRLRILTVRVQEHVNFRGNLRLLLIFTARLAHYLYANP